MILISLQSKTAARAKRNIGIRSTDEFFVAVRLGNLDKVAELLGNEIANVDITDAIGATALMVASINGYLDIVRLLISLGADIDRQDDVNGYRNFCCQLRKPQQFIFLDGLLSCKQHFMDTKRLPSI